MIKRIVIALVAVAVAAALAFGGWYYRPWSDYSPASISALDDPDAYPQTFQNMEAILPYTMVRATNPSPLPTGEADLPLSFEVEGETIMVADYIDMADITGLTVLRDGEIVSEAFFQGGDEATRFTSWSVAKSFVATLIAKALHEGLIDSLEDPAQKYVPQFEGTDYGNTSLRHLLMMSAGVDFNEGYDPDRPSDIRPFFFNAFIMGRNVDTMAGEVERNREPGEDMHYTSPNSHVLAAVARAVYGGSLPEIVEEQIWTPLGMTSDASWLLNKSGDDGMAVGYCCLQATSADFARMGEFYRLDGVWNGERLLPEGWSADATVPRAEFQEPGNTPYPLRGYGLHFWVPEGYDGEFYMAGVFGQYVWVDRHRGVVIAQNAGDETWFAKTAEAHAFFRAVSEHVSPLSSRLPDARDVTSDLPEADLEGGESEGGEQ